ncbi:hypothetical protein [Rubrivirga sp.]|uniref:hypothetical protein n=1 Tax=Rubrivirga sp. TaxID=1885344 RepID=UPI003B530195
MVSPDDRTGLLLSVSLHAVVLLLLALGLSVPPQATDPDWPPQLTEIEFGPAPTVPVQTGPPERAEAGTSSESMTQPEAERPTPPAPTQARIPERTPTPPRAERPLPRPVQSDDARPARPNPPSRATRTEPNPTSPTQPRPTTGTGTSQGDAPTAGSATGSGTGSGGDAPAEVGFQFGTRSVTYCPEPPFGGVEGQVVHRVTFAPNGRYVADRPVTRNAALNGAVRQVVSGCRAQPLPSNALQVNQTTNVTFRFRAEN